MIRPVVVVSSLHRFAPENLETSPLSMRIRETSAGQEGEGGIFVGCDFFPSDFGPSSSAPGAPVVSYRAHLLQLFLIPFFPSFHPSKKSYVRAVVSTRDMHRTGHCVLEETETAGPFAGQSFISFSVFCWKEGKQPATSARRGNTFPGRMLVRAHTHTDIYVVCRRKNSSSNPRSILLTCLFAYPQLLLNGLDLATSSFLFFSFKKTRAHQMDVHI